MFNWNIKGVLSTLALVLFGSSMYVVLGYIIVLGLFVPATMFFPELLEKVSEFMMLNPENKDLISTVPTAAMLLLLSVGAILYFKIFYLIVNLIEKVWNKIPNSIKGEPIYTKINKVERQAL